MTTAAPTDEPQNESRWGLDSSAVQRALAFIKKKGSVTVDELIEWDRTHGRRLFTWDDEEAARIGRMHEARLFLNRFRSQFERMRIRAFIHVDKDASQGIEESAYYAPETITAHPGMRAQVIADLTKRGAKIASELKFWKLSSRERDDVLERWREAIGDGS